MASNKQIQNFADKLKTALKKVKTQTQMRKFGEAAAEIIRKRTRLGYGATERSERAKLKPLSSSYKAYRAGKIAFATAKGGWVYPYKPSVKPKLHPLTTPNRSNLTFTGEMLDSLGVTKVKEGEATVDVSGNRTDGLTNQKVAGYVTAQGRPFNNLTPVEKRQIEQIIETELKKIVRLK